VAKTLIGHLEDEFKELGIQVFCTLIIDGNSESVDLFENSGYKYLDEVKYFSKRSHLDL